ncbi:uncharacterized protein LOC113329414 [Papaver somniferum]|uniref:uncharacterized protein LOC113329414 n=1 Tax=Papaver somniferum TaxID=3469 RepID=UPI000E700580|nr:uncharacterized protein LOC113329414 [Papaver somniferum]
MKKCANKVVGSFVGKRLSFDAVKIAVSKIWKFKQEVSIKLYNNSAFIFEFKEEEDRNLVLETSSIVITGELFALRPWSQLLENSITRIKSTPIWVKIFGVPLHMWDEEGLGLIASYLGKPLYADDCTINQDRLAFARVCIEIDLNFSYPASIPILIDGKIAIELRIEYQWKPSKCDACKVFGQTTNSCTLKTRPSWNPKQKLQANPAVEPLPQGSSGTEAEMVGKKQGPTVSNLAADDANSGPKDTISAVECSLPAKETNFKGNQDDLSKSPKMITSGCTKKPAAPVSVSSKSPGKQGIASGVKHTPFCLPSDFPYQWKDLAKENADKRDNKDKETVAVNASSNADKGRSQVKNQDATAKSPGEDGNCSKDR